MNEELTKSNKLKMRLIKNFNALATSPQRKICLEIIEAGLSSIQPQKIISKNLSVVNSIFHIQNKTIDLKSFQRVFLLGFGKGSAGISRSIEKILGDFLTEGHVIDLESQTFGKIEFTKGTHPLPSENNLKFSKKAIEHFNNLTTKDLIIVVIAGGGSALFENPYKISLEKLVEVNKALLRSGANIKEMNVVRKHLSKVKGGGLAKLLYPAKIISLIASDVPGNDLSVIASGPTVKDETTKEEAIKSMRKFNLLEKLKLAGDDFLETPKEDKYFANVSNILILSNKIALSAMQEKANDMGFNTVIYSDKFQGEAKFAGKTLIEKTPPHTVLLVGGETTVKVKGQGKGGRNQEVALGALQYLPSGVVIASIDSDGWDNSQFAGAIGDYKTLEIAKGLNLDLNKNLENNNTLPFFEKTGDGILTGRLPSNVSDLIIVLRQ